MSTVPERAEIDEQHKWALGSIFESDDAWAEHFETVSGRIEEFEAYEGRVTESPETLLELLELREEIMREVAQLSVYANLRSSEDTRNQEYQALSGKAEALSSEASSATSYIEPEIQELTEDDIDAFIEEEPALAEYEHFFDDVLRGKPHTRSTEVEELLAELGEVTSSPSEIYSMLSNADMEFPTVEDPDGEDIEISQANFTTLQKHENRAFRQRVHEAYYDEWETVRNTVGTSLKKQVRKDVKVARARNYETAREAALDGPNVPVEVYDTLVETVHDNLDSLHRHAEIKRDALGVDDLQMWDLYTSITGEEGPDVEYEQAKEWIIEAVEPLGESYRDRLAEGLDSRWVDVYENRGKRSGAFSSGTYDTQPFILMNYQDDISSMFTLAHELGHSMHSELAQEAQPWHDASYEIFVAEVASTVNETLLTQHLLETVDDDELRLHVLDEYLERFRSTLYRQTMFAEFEQRIHERAENDEPLTPDVFDELYGGLKSDYYEPAVIDDRIHREWQRIPHFYYNFYVYQYATGISAAVAIVDGILGDSATDAVDESAAADYREMLAAGGSVYPIEALELAGIDMTSADPIESALGVYDTYLDRIDELR
ncbi:oligoendopeptidase F [Halonotius aquaticus]|uniref:Oligoendopeptidase F n=1 Tax=Halonotius aquaticus TaxID=2216978 RepID=A0A3A6PKZ8_9EURY|nr:oligoendopeptidase F [Halonotius aquaticus]RJX42119.1 oligoendopeptidase F [Halonotius aquaticus]